MFYPDKRKHLSPSSIASWHNAKSSFIKSYFVGEERKETASIRTGKQIHALIEAGIINVHKKYGTVEQPIEVPLGKGLSVYGIPDSAMDTVEDGETHFVDYKSGKQNGWNDATLANDIKMKVTAWLVFQNVFIKTGEYPKKVIGFIEYIPTQYNYESREVEPTGEDSSVVATREYLEKELQEFTAFINNTVDEVNEGYEQWKGSTADFISQDDVLEYAENERKIAEIQEQQKAIKERIEAQMDIGKTESYTFPLGTFYFTTRKTYKYPSELKVNYNDMGLTLEDVEAIQTATSVAKKNFEQEHEPASVSRSLGFRSSKKK